MSKGSHLIRSFIAITIPQKTTNELGDIAAKMSYQDKSGAVRWVDQQNYHITLAFLGDLEESELEALAEELDERLPETGLQVDIKGFSPFPEGKPKMIAAMIAGNDELKELQRKVLLCAKVCGITLGKRRFIPHITLGRYRHSKNHFAGGIPASIDLKLDVSEVALFSSTLTSGGAEYEALFRFPLDGFGYQDDDYQDGEYGVIDEV